jgi:threonine dehydratase
LFDVKQEVLEAEQRIRKYIRKTPLEYSPYLSKIGKCNVYLKLENYQHTGSFKARGALNKVLSLSKGLEAITASTGNHGLAVAYALKIIGESGTIYLPKTTTQTKIKALETYNVELVFHGSESMETEVFARGVAEKDPGKVFISPYNDPYIIGGQGTIGIELLNQLPEIDNVLASIGGGGLISGIAGYIKNIKPNTKVIGCLPENSPVMFESIKAGEIIDMEIKPSLSDGTAGGIEPNAITFPICQQYVDDYLIVNEKEIMTAIFLMLEQHHLIIEGAAGVTIAAFLKTIDQSTRFEGENVILIVCGSNIGIEALKGIMCNQDHEKIS